MTPRKPSTYVVYVTYRNNAKEYAYLCNIPGLCQGDEVLANNGARVTVVRTANFDPLATRYVSPAPDHDERRVRERKKEIYVRLQEIEHELANADRFKKLASRSPEAKKLLNELKGLA